MTLQPQPPTSAPASTSTSTSQLPTTTFPTSNIALLLPSLLPRIESHLSKKTSSPFTLALTGLQGSGKSTYTSALCKTLSSAPYNYTVLSVSLDDFYLDHEGLLARREKDAENKLYRTRGQPGTHDEVLAMGFWEGVALVSKAREEGGMDLKIPEFDKGAFGGEGDRVDSKEWKVMSAGSKVDIVIFEGWCVGFMPIGEEEVKAKYEETCAEVRQRQGGGEGDGSESSVRDETYYSTHTLPDHTLQHLLILNSALARYTSTFLSPAKFNYLIHLDTPDLATVYMWRISQEDALKKARGQNAGMSTEQVVAFVRGYMPAYELYLDGLRKGRFFEGADPEEKGVLRVELDEGRNVVGVKEVGL